MSKKDLVEVTIKVPRELVDLLKAEKYMGYSKEQFFEMAIRGHIGGVANHYHYKKAMKFYRKYGKDIGTFYLPKGLDC